MAKAQAITRAAMKPLLDPYGLVEAVRRGDALHIAGQTGLSHEHRMVEGGLKAQARRAFANIREIVELAGGQAEDLVSLTWYLADTGRAMFEDATEVLAAKEEILPGIRVAATAVRVKELLTPEILIEIQAVALL